MNVVSEPLTREDRFLRTNNRLLLAYAASFGLWQAADLTADLATGNAHSVMRVIAVATWALWSTFLVVHIIRLRVVRKDPLLRAVFEDERMKDVRLRAYRASFWVTIASAALLGVPAAAHLFPAFVATKIIVTIGVVAFLVATIVFDSE